MITRTINAAVGSVTKVLPRIVGDQLWRHGTETDVSQTALQTVRILQARHRLEERQVLRHTHTKQWRHWSWWTVVDHETHMNTNKSQSITNIHWLAWKHDFLDCENGEQDCRSSTLRSLDHEKRTAFVMVNNCTQPFDTVYFTKNLSYIGVLSDNSSLTSSI